MSDQGRATGTSRRRISVVLACTTCLTRNYKTTKVARDGAAPLALKKFCKVCNAHTVHEEAR